jgi:hypothetical protein
MKDKIKAAIQGAHKSVINGVDYDLATTKVEEVFKAEISDIITKFDILLSNPEINAYWAIWHMSEELKNKYNLHK